MDSSTLGAPQFWREMEFVAAWRVPYWALRRMLRLCRGWPRALPRCIFPGTFVLVAGQHEAICGHLAQNLLLQSTPKLSWPSSSAAPLRYSCAPILASAAPCTACDAPVAHGHLQRLSALLRTARHR